MDSNEQIPLDNVSDYINDFFINIGPNLATKCNRPWHYCGDESDNSLTSISTTSEEILDIVRKININKTSCISNLSGEILRDAFMVLPNTLHQIP